VAKLVELMEENLIFANFILPISLSKNGEISPERKSTGEYLYTYYTPVKCFLWASFRHFEDFSNKEYPVINSLF
jgi:hypothetical protein